MENQILDQSEAYSDVIKYASFWERVGASLIDFLIFIPVYGLSYYNSMSIKSLPLAIILSLAYLVYKIYMEGKSGATIGKRAMKIKVVTEDNQPINMGTSAVRASLYIINGLVGIMTTVMLFQTDGFQDVTGFMETSQFQQEHQSNFAIVTTILLVISVLFVAFDKKKQALHDKIAKTICVTRS
ncbi:MAG: RDD family protein [Bacteroidetes bacterium]|jgi:uncharacterized RDD family membrane protein YckC|nr:RDD family protein [Bacteroidota bacterium]